MRQARTILVAEKHPATRTFLAHNLAADGYEVLAAEDRSKAIALLDTGHSDLVVVDVNGDTLGLLDTVRGADGLAGRVDPDTPMILLTGEAETLQRIRMLERGGDDVLVKPFSYPGKNRQKVRRYLIKHAKEEGWPIPSSWNADGTPASTSGRSVAYANLAYLRPELRGQPPRPKPKLPPANSTRSIRVELNKLSRQSRGATPRDRAEQIWLRILESRSATDSERRFAREALDAAAERELRL